MQPSAPEILAVYLHQAGLERFDLGLVLGLDTLPFLFVALVARDVAASATVAASAVDFLHPRVEYLDAVVGRFLDGHRDDEASPEVVARVFVDLYFHVVLEHLLDRASRAVAVAAVRPVCAYSVTDLNRMGAACFSRLSSRRNDFLSCHLQQDIRQPLYGERFL